DAPVVASLTGARLIGSASTLNIGLGLGMHGDQLQRVAPGQKVSFGDWTLTFIASRHGPSPISICKGHDTINAPLVPPQRFSAWCAGEIWTILVAHKDGPTMLVNASAGFPEHGLDGVH